MLITPSFKKTLIVEQFQGNYLNSCNWFVLTDILIENGDELNSIFPKFARPLYFFFSSALWHLQK